MSLLEKKNIYTPDDAQLFQLLVTTLPLCGDDVPSSCTYAAFCFAVVVTLPLAGQRLLVRFLQHAPGSSLFF